MNADNLMSINCNRIYRNQFLDELTAITAFSARQFAKYTNSIFVSQIYRMAIYRAKSVPQKSPTSTDLRSNEITKISVLHTLRLTSGQCCRANQCRLRSTIKNYSAAR